jgi:hypothetical protein
MLRWTAIGTVCLLAVAPIAAYAQSSSASPSAPAKASGKARGGDVTREEYIIDAKAHAARLANRRFDAIDTQKKGVITRDQYVKYYEGRSAQFAQRRFDQIDKDHNGVIEQSELDAWRAAHQRPRRPAATAPAAK